MKARFEGTPFRGVGKDFGGDAAALGGVWDQFVDDVVGVDRLDALLA